MHMRRATDAELPEVVALVNTAFRGSEGWAVEFRVVDGPRLTLESLRADIAAKPQAFQLVSRDEADNTLLGSAWIEPLTDTLWYLGLLCVRPDAQTRQLGRTLLADTEAFARDRGAQRMRISVMNVRDTLAAWYERRGYIRTGETKPFPYGDTTVGTPLRDDLSFIVLEKQL
jgi:N-acetylglutamate synthase-like GNAT family acetyltransferase